MDLKTALATLDPAEDGHWTADGLPRLDHLANLTGEKLLKRKDVTDAAPSLTRDGLAQDKENQDDPAAAAGAGDGADDPQPDAPAGAERFGEPTGRPVEPAPVADGPDTADESAGKPSILERDWVAIASDMALVEDYQRELTDYCQGLLVQKRALEERLKLLYARSEMVSRHLVKLQRGQKNGDTAVIRDYLAQQAKAREARALRADEFIRAGTTQADVQDRLRQNSRLDAALNQRKPSPGSTRPAPRMPVRY